MHKCKYNFTHVSLYPFQLFFALSCFICFSCPLVLFYFLSLIFICSYFLVFFLLLLPFFCSFFFFFDLFIDNFSFALSRSFFPSFNQFSFFSLTFAIFLALTVLFHSYFLLFIWPFCSIFFIFLLWSNMQMFIFCSYCVSFAFSLFTLSILYYFCLFICCLDFHCFTLAFSFTILFLPLFFVYRFSLFNSFLYSFALCLTLICFCPCSSVFISISFSW